MLIPTTCRLPAFDPLDDFQQDRCATRYRYAPRPRLAEAAADTYLDEEEDSDSDSSTMSLKPLAGSRKRASPQQAQAAPTATVAPRLTLNVLPARIAVPDANARFNAAIRASLINQAVRPTVDDQGFAIATTEALQSATADPLPLRAGEWQGQP